MLASVELRRGIGNTGLLFPSRLESAYLSLYALPPPCKALLDWNGERNRVHAFLCLLRRTLCAYAPLLDQMDMPRSVFPSGHAAGGFSTAFGIWGAVPERALLWGSTFTLAILVYVATVYCRYHYAVVGLTSILIGGFAYAASRRGGAIA